MAEPGAAVRDRVHRHLLEWQYEVGSQRIHIANGYQGLPAPLMTMLQQQVDDNQQHISGWAAAQGFKLNKNGHLADRRLSPTEALIGVLAADPAAQGQGAVLGAYRYNRDSAVAHGLPSGVSRRIG